jgi:hypothetical protein
MGEATGFRAAADVSAAMRKRSEEDGLCPPMQGREILTRRLSPRIGTDALVRTRAYWGVEQVPDDLFRDGCRITGLWEEDWASPVLFSWLPKHPRVADMRPGVAAILEKWHSREQTRRLDQGFAID